MTVTLTFRTVEDNSLFQTSETVVNLLTDLKLDDVDINVPPQYSSVLHIYLDFVNKISFDELNKVIYPDNLLSIDDVDTLLLCFDMESFFADQAFFVYLMRQTYKVWNSFYQHVPSLPDERLVYLYTPYEFVPEKYMNRPPFFKEWLEINANSKVVLNGNEVYYTDVTYYSNGQIDKLKAYHTINEQEVGYSFKVDWYDNPSIQGGQLEYRTNYKNGKLDGLQEGWYKNGQAKYRTNYKDGKLDGLQEAWYANPSIQGGQLEYRTNYKDGKLDGLWEAWYADGQREYRWNYKDDEPDGPWEYWYAGGQPEYRFNYKDGKQDGLQEGWYADGQDKYRTNYKDGKRDGLQKGWYADGRPKYVQEYRMDVLISEQQF